MILLNFEISKSFSMMLQGAARGHMSSRSSAFVEVLPDEAKGVLRSVFSGGLHVSTHFTGIVFLISQLLAQLRVLRPRQCWIFFTSATSSADLLRFS